MTDVAHEARTDGAPRSATPIVVVSSDTHVGPRLETDLRPYCPAAYLDRFDDFTRSFRSVAPEDFADPEFIERFGAIVGHNLQTAGHNDVHARLADMDRDGVAAEVIFHGSQNGEPIPFTDLQDQSTDDELDRVGRGIYNRWLADFCSVAPERHVGLAQINLSDMGAAIEEVRWAREHGLRGVNFPALRPGLPAFESPEWEPFFATCEDLGMVLNTHIGSMAMSLQPAYSGPVVMGLASIELAWLGRRGIWHLIFTGVFERYPDLQLVITEIPGAWWTLTLEEMDSIYDAWLQGEPLRQTLPRRPSEYARTNVSFGASFQSRAEAEEASDGGFTDRFMWGSDYPHPEGTFHYPDDEEAVSVTRLAIQNTFHGLPEEDVRRMCGENATRVYGLDRDALRRIAAEISAPTPEDLAVPADLSLVPAEYHGYAFRTGRGSFG